MLPYKYRLVKRRDFEKIYRYGKLFCFEAFFCIKAAENGRENSRIGISIGLKYSKKASERNRIKRQLREIARKNLTKMKAGFDVVILIKKRIDNVSQKKLDEMYKKTIKMAGLTN